MILRRFPAILSLTCLKWRLALVGRRPPRRQIWSTGLLQHPNPLHDHDGAGM